MYTNIMAQRAVCCKHNHTPIMMGIDTHLSVHSTDIPTQIYAFSALSFPSSSPLYQGPPGVGTHTIGGMAERQRRPRFRTQTFCTNSSQTKRARTSAK